MAGIETMCADKPDKPASSASAIMTIKNVFRIDSNMKYSFSFCLLSGDIHLLSKDQI
jgi:hypothetical protein